MFYTLKKLFNCLTLLMLLAPVLAIVAIATGKAELAMQIYWPLAFWTVVAIDFHKTQMKENGASEVNPANFSFADRFLLYMFVAPFIYPFRLFSLIAGQRQAIS